MNVLLLKTGFRVWLMEILVSGFNFSVLMNLVYEPRLGVLMAYQIGMSKDVIHPSASLEIVQKAQEPILLAEVFPLFCI